MSEDRNYSLSSWSDEQRPLPPRNADESYDAYFRRLLSEWSVKAREAEQVHERWRTRIEMGGGLRESDCLHRIFIVLKELMNSVFLKNDYIDTGMPKADCEQAIEELQMLGFGELCETEGADWKFALLTRYLRKQGEIRVIVDETRAGFYIDEVREQIPEDAAEAFFRFATFTRLAYQEIDRMKEESLGKGVTDCLAKMKMAIEPLRSHVTKQFVKHYDIMWKEILDVGDLQQRMLETAPRNFEGGHNQKLTCNIVGLLCGQNVYDLNPKQTDEKIYTDKTTYTYINNYAAADGKVSLLDTEEIKAIKKIVSKYA